MKEKQMVKGFLSMFDLSEVHCKTSVYNTNIYQYINKIDFYKNTPE